MGTTKTTAVLSAVVAGTLIVGPAAAMASAASLDSYPYG